MGRQSEEIGVIKFKFRMTLSQETKKWTFLGKPSESTLLQNILLSDALVLTVSQTDFINRENIQEEESYGSHSCLRAQAANSPVLYRAHAGASCSVEQQLAEKLFTVEVNEIWREALIARGDENSSQTFTR